MQVLNRWIVRILFFSSIGSIGQFSQISYALSSLDVDQQWSPSGSSVLTRAQIDQLLNLADEDPEVRHLVDSILKKTEVLSPDQLLSVLKLCPELTQSEGGMFIPGKRQISMKSLSLPEEESPWSSEVEEAMQKSFASERIKTSVLNLSKWESLPTVCVRPGQTVLNSFLAFIHEFTHFRGYVALKSIDVLEYLDGDDYAKKNIKDSWGELLAYTAEYSVLKRIKNRLGLTKSYPMERFFDSQGNLEDSAGLEKYILNTLGYRSILVSEFEGKVKSQYNTEIDLLNWFKVGLRKKIEQNIRSAEVEKNERKRAFYSNYLKNLQKEIERLEGRIQEMERRFFTAQGNR